MQQKKRRGLPLWLVIALVCFLVSGVMLWQVPAVRVLVLTRPTSTTSAGLHLPLNLVNQRNGGAPVQAYTFDAHCCKIKIDAVCARQSAGMAFSIQNSSRAQVWSTHLTCPDGKSDESTAQEGAYVLEVTATGDAHWGITITQE